LNGRRLAAAHEAYTATTEIQERLSKIDQSSIGWQIELAFTHLSIGLLFDRESKFADAKLSFVRAQAILRDVLKASPANAQARSMLTVVNEQLSPPASSVIGRSAAGRQR